MASTGRYSLEDGSTINVADVLSRKFPNAVEDTGLSTDIESMSPHSGRFVKEDGSIVNIAEAIKKAAEGGGGGGGEVELVYTTPSEHGAVGDGLHDDAPGLIAAFNSGKIVVLDKDYYLKSEIWIHNKNIVFDGLGHTLHCDHANLLFSSDYIQDENADMYLVTANAPWYGTYHKGYVAQNGDNPIGEDLGEDVSVKYFNKYSAVIANVTILMTNGDRLSALELRRMCHSVIDNVSTICEEGHDAAIGINVVYGYDVVVKNSFSSNFAARKTWRESNTGYGINVDGTHTIVDNCVAEKCKHDICTCANRELLSVGTIVRNCTFRRDWNDRGNENRYQQQVDAHANGINPIYENLNIICEHATNSTPMLILRSQYNTVRNVNIIADDGWISWQEAAEKILFDNLNAPNCVFQAVQAINDAREIKFVNSHLKALENIKNQAVINLENTTIEYRVQDVQYLKATNSTFRTRGDVFATMTPMTILGECWFDNCTIYGNDNEFISKALPIIKIPKNRAHISNCKFYYKNGFTRFKTDQDYLVNCEFYDIYGLNLDTEGNLDERNLQ